MIELKNISYTYEKQEVFRSLSLSVKRGEKVGILGESGCGKSTLLKIIAGLYKPTEGTVLVDGVSMPCHAVADASAPYYTGKHHDGARVPER